MNKIYSLLGLARRANLVSLGQDGCNQAIKRNKCKLLIIANDTSDNTKEKFIKLCDRKNVRYVFFGDKESLGQAIGRDIVAIISILDENFSKAIMDKIG
ncbi:L7Ae/L30e/S12e/Gadd45 family ribosomal protein [Dethiothermospora halolimnae]|uniref:L7Ae/L30e/S12e/Gadd45 family ribosomal protein n=1 Tax=Dethiothermospora halolimnae TaxID=3114390 RepID=UPI003CCB9745